MTVGSRAKVRGGCRTGLMALCFALVGLAAVPASALETPFDADELDARSSPFTSMHPQSHSASPLETKLQSQVSEARRVLVELQDFVEQAAAAVKLGDQLKTRKRENDRLRRSLSSTRSVNALVQDDINPTSAAISNLTGTIVDNWLEMVRLEEYVDRADQELLRSETAWLSLEERAASLRRVLGERREELRLLRTKTAALRTELQRTRRSIALKEDERRQSERKRRQIDATIVHLRQQVTATLRAVLLDASGR